MGSINLLATDFPSVLNGYRQEKEDLQLNTSGQPKQTAVADVGKTNRNVFNNSPGCAHFALQRLYLLKAHNC